MTNYPKHLAAPASLQRRFRRCPYNSGDLIPIKQWALNHHYSVSTVRKQIRSGRLAGWKINGRWYVFP